MAHFNPYLGGLPGYPAFDNNLPPNGGQGWVAPIPGMPQMIAAPAPRVDLTAAGFYPLPYAQAQGPLPAPPHLPYGSGPLGPAFVPNDFQPQFPQAPAPVPAPYGQANYGYSDASIVPMPMPMPMHVPMPMSMSMSMPISMPMSELMSMSALTSMSVLTSALTSVLMSMPQTYNQPVLVGVQTPTPGTGGKRGREAEDFVSNKRHRETPEADPQQTASVPKAPRPGEGAHLRFDGLFKTVPVICQGLKEVKLLLDSGKLKSLSLSLGATVAACKKLSAILDPAAGLEVLIVEHILHGKGLNMFFETLEKATRLRTLDWQSQHIELLIPRLNGMTGLKTLIAGSNGCTGNFSPQLLNTLQQNKAIENLKLGSLSGCKTGQELCGLLKENRSLKTIEVA